MSIVGDFKHTDDFMVDLVIEYFDYDILIYVNKFSLILIFINFIFFLISILIHVVFIYKIKKYKFDEYLFLAIYLLILNFFFFIVVISQNILLNYLILIILQFFIYFVLINIRIFKANNINNYNEKIDKVFFYVCCLSDFFILLSVSILLNSFGLEQNFLIISRLLAKFLENSNVITMHVCENFEVVFTYIDILYISMYLGTILKFIYMFFILISFFNFK